MVKIHNVFGDIYKGKQGTAVYQRHGNGSMRRKCEGKKPHKSEGQNQQAIKFKTGSDWYRTLTDDEKKAIKQHITGRNMKITVWNWCIRVATTPPGIS